MKIQCTDVSLVFVQIVYVCFYALLTVDFWYLEKSFQVGSVGPCCVPVLYSQYISGILRRVSKLDLRDHVVCLLKIIGFFKEFLLRLY